MLQLLRTTVFILLFAVAAHGAKLGEDGLYEETWISNTFMDLREDLAEANDSQKRLLVLFEQKGCGYCKRMHEKVYSVPEIARKLQEDFFVIRVNIFGDLEVTDFDERTYFKEMRQHTNKVEENENGNQNQNRWRKSKAQKLIDAQKKKVEKVKGEVESS